MAPVVIASTVAYTCTIRLESGEHFSTLTAYHTLTFMKYFEALDAFDNVNDDSSNRTEKSVNSTSHRNMFESKLAELNLKGPTLGEVHIDGSSATACVDRSFEAFFQPTDDLLCFF